MGCATWDQQTAMGGPGSIDVWAHHTPSLASSGGIHLRMRGYRALASGLFEDLMHAYDGWTHGEGGALTTDDDELFEKLDALRNCGRRREKEASADVGSGLYGQEGNFIQSGNYRITEFQATILLEALARLPDQNAHRDENAQYLNRLLEEIPGVMPMRRDPREHREA